MDSFQFKRAVRAQARLRLAIAGVSGSGKTMGALRLARGIVEEMLRMGLATGGLEGKIAVIDTERSSAALYAHVVPFDTLNLEPPYTVDRYQQALRAAEQAGYAVVIMDQISHAWAGPGGQLEWIDTLKASAKNAMSPWAKVTPVQQEFYDRILRSPCHIIATMRSKSEWVLDEQIDERTGRKKTVPRKIGMSPVQREGIEYEFTTCLDVELESHMATASKDRTSMFMDRATKLDEETGANVAKWLYTGEAAPVGAPVERAPDPAPGDPPPQSGGAGMGPEEAEKLAALVGEVEDKVSDFELQMGQAQTLPEVASIFAAAQTYARESRHAIGADRARPFVDRVTKAKDVAKARLQGPAEAPAAQTPAQAPAEAPAPAQAPVAASAGMTTAGGVARGIVDGLAVKSAQKITGADAEELARRARQVGLTDAEAVAALGVPHYTDVLLSTFSTAIGLLDLAGKKKSEAAGAKKPARKRAK